MSLGDTRCIIVCVDYSDCLRISLEWNKQHFDSTLVITSPDDSNALDVSGEFGADTFTTRVFTERGASFNKYAALELGLDYYGRHGWIALMDADILLPRNMRAWTKRIGCLYTPRRRLFPRIPQSTLEVPLERQWRQYRYPHPKESFDGYCQIFHSSDPVLGQAPWHSTSHKWCSGPSDAFQNKWQERSKVRPAFDVLHIGERGRNWAGRVTPFADGSLPGNHQKNSDMFQVLMRARRDKSSLKRMINKEIITDEDVPESQVRVF